MVPLALSWGRGSSSSCIMASMKGGTVYTGVTGNLAGRIWQLKTHADPGSFTARYKVERLVWYEVHETAMSAIQREKRIRTGSARGRTG